MRLIARWALAALFVSSPPAAIAQTAQTMFAGADQAGFPVTIGGKTVWIRAITCTDASGVYTGCSGSGGSAGDPSYTGVNGSTTIPANIAVTGGWDGTSVKRFLTDSSGRLGVNINTMPAITISGTVPVSGTFWQATQPISGAVTANLGTLNGAATAANQLTISGQLPATLGAKTSAASLSVAPSSDGLFQVQGAAASGATAVGNPVQTGCVYNSTQPTVPTGQVWACQLDNRANTKVALMSGATALAADTSNAFGTSLSVTVGPTSNFSAGVSVATATATTAGLVIKASAGTLYGLAVVNSTSAGFVCVVNANAVPADGAVTDTTVLYAQPIAASAGLRETFNPPIPFSSGMSAFISSSYCSTKAAVTATKFLGYYK